jgi:hypothetical protein
MFQRAVMTPSSESKQQNQRGSLSIMLCAGSTLCSLVDVYGRFEVKHCLHLPGRKVRQAHNHILAFVWTLRDLSLGTSSLSLIRSHGEVHKLIIFTV